MPPPPPELMDELVEEILLRLPPDSPASLVRAGLICKRWCHLVSDPGFQRRFREHHRSPPILGFLNTHIDDDGSTAVFVPEPASGLRRAYHPRLHPRECRHGRVLLYSYHYDTAIVVWDPITGERVQLPKPPPPLLLPSTWTVAVLCAAAATPGGTCDHLDCHGGAFIVVLLMLEIDTPRISSYVYSSESGAWSEPMISSPHSGGKMGGWARGALLVGNALYFMPYLCTTVLQYDLGTREIVAIHLPNATQMDTTQLIATQDGRLGFASVAETTLFLWSREVVGGGIWALRQVIDLKKLLLAMDFPRATIVPYLVGSAEGTGVIFLRVNGLRLVAIDLWSSGMVTTEVYEREPRSYISMMVVPYMVFFTPVLSRPPCTDAGPRASASSA